MPLALPEASPMAEWPILPATARPVLAAAAARLQPVALEPAATPRDWPLLPDQRSSDLTPIELVQTYSPAGTNAAILPFGGVAPNGVLRLSVVVAPARLMLRSLACAITQFGAVGNVAMGIYDRFGVLLGQTGQVAVSAADVLNIPLLSPTSIVGGVRHYLAFWTSINGLGVYGLTGIFAGAGPTVSCEVPNTTYPLPAGPISLSNKVTQTIYVAGLET